jgi:hypothetical protein
MRKAATSSIYILIYIPFYILGFPSVSRLISFPSHFNFTFYSIFYSIFHSTFHSTFRFPSVSHLISFPSHFSFAFCSIFQRSDQTSPTRIFWAGPWDSQTLDQTGLKTFAIPDRPKGWAICLGPAQIGPAQIAQTTGQPRWTGISPNTVELSRCHRCLHYVVSRDCK